MTRWVATVLTCCVPIFGLYKYKQIHSTPQPAATSLCIIKSVHTVTLWGLIFLLQTLGSVDTKSKYARNRNESGFPTVHTDLFIWTFAAAESADIKKMKIFDRLESETRAWWDKCVFLRVSWGKSGFSSSAWLPVRAAWGDRALYLLTGRQVLDGFVTFQDAFFSHGSAQCITPPSTENTRVSKECCVLSTEN